MTNISKALRCLRALKKYIDGGEECGGVDIQDVFFCLVERVSKFAQKRSGNNDSWHEFAEAMQSLSRFMGDDMDYEPSSYHDFYITAISAGGYDSACGDIASSLGVSQATITAIGTQGLYASDDESEQAAREVRMAMQRWEKLMQHNEEVA